LFARRRLFLLQHSIHGRQFPQGEKPLFIASSFDSKITWFFSCGKPVQVGRWNFFEFIVIINRAKEPSKGSENVK
jgi:hypothetical protein